MNVSLILGTVLHSKLDTPGLTLIHTNDSRFIWSFE